MIVKKVEFYHCSKTKNCDLKIEKKRILWRRVNVQFETIHQFVLI